LLKQLSLINIYLIDVNYHYLTFIITLLFINFNWMNQNKIEKQTFTYPFIFRIIFRYGNIILTPILILYSTPLFYFLDDKPILAFPILVNLGIIYFLNRHYLNLYKIMPYRIQADDEKIFCSNFFLSKKEITIYYNDISSLTGGIFHNKISGLMKVCDDRNNFCIGFYHRLSNSSMLATIILSKVKRELYDNVLDKIKSSGKRTVKK